MRTRLVSLFSIVVFTGCAHHPVVRGLVPPGTPPAVDIAAARTRGSTVSVAWSPWSSETFARARREHRPVVFDGAAEWCHWCHVMDETTWRDPAVVARIHRDFIAVRVDIDSRPDLAARYAPWGWPAIVMFSPEGREIAHYRGYQPPDPMLALLGAALHPPPAQPTTDATGPEGSAPDDGETPGFPPPLEPEALATLGPWVTRALDDAYDPVHGSWGTWQKVALGANVLFELRRAAHGDTAAGARAVFTLGQQRALIDPVWGGVDQYSAGATWTDPHFEKLMVFQTTTIEATAAGWTAFHDPVLLADARHVEGFLNGFLTDPSGAFLASMDADVNAHDRAAAFVDGHVYQALDDSHRRALGLPRVDPTVYARENGLALGALADLYAADPTPSTLARATRAAEVCLTGMVTAEGAVVRTPGVDVRAPRFLADAAALGRGLARLAAVTAGPVRARYLEAAQRIAQGMARDFGTGQGALWDTAGEPDGPLPRSRSVEANVSAARFLAALATATGDHGDVTRARAVLAASATPAAVASLGRMLGDLLLALDDAGLYPWGDAASAGGRWPGEHHVLTVALTRGALDVSVQPTDGQHINTSYPVSLTLEARGATVPGVLHRSDAVVSDSGLGVHAGVTGATPGAVVRGVLRFALCGTETCVPQSRWFTVTVP